MEENKNQVAMPVFSGTDIVRMIFNKLKFIICFSLIVTILAGAAAVWLEVPNIQHGTELEFHLTKQDKNDSLLSLLRSESFAEMLLLDEYGLPEELQGTEQYNQAKQAIIAYKTAREELRDERTSLVRLKQSLTSPKDPKTGETLSSYTYIQQEYTRLVDVHTAAYELLTIYKSVQAEASVTQEHLARIEQLERELDAAYEAKEAFRLSAYAPAQQEILAAEESFTVNHRKYTDLMDEAKDLVDPILSEWRSDEKVRSDISKIKSSLSFGYAIPGSTLDDTPAKGDDNYEDYINISFLQVSVVVNGNDEELADLIVERLKERLPEYAEIQLDLTYETVYTKCELISSASVVKRLNFSDVILSIAIVPAVAFFVSAAASVMCILGLEWLRKKEIINQKTKK